MRSIVSITVAIGVCGSAAAQFEKGTFLFEVIGGPVSPTNPVVTVKLYAAFPIYTPGGTALGDANLHLLSSDATGQFFDMQKGEGLQPGCSLAALVTPTAAGGVDSLIFKQIGILGCQPNPAAPCHVWEAKWTTTNSKPRDVLLESAATTIFHIFSSLGKEYPDIILFPNNFEHGSGVIQVVPVPGSAAVIIAAIALAARRRRD